ncbi:MAG: patatin-like phospholipase family protein [Pseudomonadota bacterium]
MKLRPPRWGSRAAGAASAATQPPKTRSPRVTQVFVLVSAATLSGCVTWAERPELGKARADLAPLEGVETARIWSDAPAERWLQWRSGLMEQRRQAGQSEQLEILAISSGSEKGAYSAGFLNGWTKTGTRPQFDIVSGVSTGALIAPFAFLGTGYDDHLRTLYTQIETRHIYRPTTVSGFLGGPALADTSPMAQLIEMYVDDDVLERVAIAHRQGRRLLVQTTHLDAGRGVVWDLGALAASDRSDRLSLFRQVLLASASIHGLFPPVLIRPGSQEMSTVVEMHVDGGTTSSLFAAPPSILYSEGASAPRLASRITILYNGQLAPDAVTVQPRAFEVLERALSVSIIEADRRSLAALRAFAEKNGTSLRVFEAGDLSDEEVDERFDTEFMRMLFAQGVARAKKAFAPPAAHI